MEYQQVDSITMHASEQMKRTPLEYLYRLNVMGMQAKILVKDGSATVRKEHVDHFIDTLDDRDLANQLLLLRVEDASKMEDTLREYQRGRSRQGKAVMGSNKYRQKGSAMPAPIPSKPARAVRAIRVEESSSESEWETSSGSEEESDRRVVKVAAKLDRSTSDRLATNPRSIDPGNGSRRLDRNAPLEACTHCGSTKHNDLGCWRRLTCQKCGRKGHPSDSCFFVCRACGEAHEIGKCPMEEFYNLIRQWYVPDKHAGMFPEKIEKMLN